MHSILVKDFMDRNPHALPEQASVRDAVLFLCSEKIAGAPVVNSEGIVVGFCGRSPSVTSVMTKEVRSVTPETSIVDIAQTMVETAPRNYPVIENNRLVGTITRSCVLAALVKLNEACYAPK